MDQTLLGTAGLLAAGAITPGPNNLVVLRAAARSGWRGAVRPIAGIVSGGLVLLVLSSLGIGAILETEPRFAVLIAVAGCLYLGFLGLRLMSSRARGDEDPESDSLPAGAWGLFVFQFLNPKAWLLVLTVCASAQARLGVLAAVPPLLALFALVPTACLSLWSWAGVGLQRALGRERVRARFDGAMGLLLMACALLLLIQIWR